MLTLCFATNNRHKLEEVQQALGAGVKLVTLEDIGCYDEIEEPFDTIQKNSEAKARFVWDRYGIDTFADDSGLVIPALNGEPGVYSARYAGPQRDDKDNIRLVWEKLADKSDRSAYFITVITLMLNGRLYAFEGIVNGTILPEERGNNGFGYDPVFLPEGSEQTFAEMSLQEKSELSHRARAVRKLNEFLTRNFQ
ncbi:non-canonical purine NTP diphosphatase [Ravibacter arvi]|uniref:dITP/XTP pyrophosphatase n=1 Tax=Ravibacter arvi TaxID=2051041 RepID=A0ABP8LTN8_9BACT